MVRVGAIGENGIERVVLATGAAPTPLLDTMGALLLARTVMAATTLGVFEAFADGPHTAGEAATRCGTDPRATATLLDALRAAGYLRLVPAERRNGGKRAGLNAAHLLASGKEIGYQTLTPTGEVEREISAPVPLYALAPVARRWMLADSPRSLRDAVLHRYLDLALLDHAEDYLRTGRPTDFHSTMTPEQWGIYQRGQRSHALFSAPEVARRIPMPRGARAMLDIGGAHGHYSVALCQRHPRLRATVLDLPAAVEHAAPLLAAEGMGQRVVHQAGDALTDDLGVGRFDLVLLANLVHHFDDATNRALMARISRALRPGGVVAVLDIIRPTPESAALSAGQMGALTDFYFAMTSEAGTWSYTEMAAWQSAAGLRPRRPIRLLTAPGVGLQAATKPKA